MASRPRLDDGAPGPGFRDRHAYDAFDRHVLPLAVEAGETDAKSFIDRVRDLYDVHPWTVARWLWSAHARALIEATDEHYGAFRVRPAEAAARLNEIDQRGPPRWSNDRIDPTGKRLW